MEQNLRQAKLSFLLGNPDLTIITLLLFWPESAYSIEVQGVEYTRKEFEELKAKWEERNNIWYIDESELVF